jgi:hypothetical protein
VRRPPPRWPVEIGTVLGLVLVIGAGATWSAAVWAVWTGVLPGWSLAIVAAMVLVAVAAVARAAARRRDAANLLAPWSNRAVRSVELRAASEGPFVLSLELAPDGEQGEPPVTLRFHGVTGLQLRHASDDVPWLPGLRCERLARRRDGEQRFAVGDPWREWIHFHCTSVEPVASPASGAAG